MKTLSETKLENKLIKELIENGYSFVKINNEQDLLNNFKKQLELFNNKELKNQELSINEFEKVLSHLQNGTLIEKAKKLRDRFQLTLDNNETIYIRFLNIDKWCQNIYQITHQITIKGKYKNRYDTTILINGLPLTQIEEKKNGENLKEAFKQIKRYKKHSYSFNSTLFDYIQIFVITNETNTKYYTNNDNLNFDDTFFWTDNKNEKITNLFEFATTFLEKCKLSEIISQYIVISENQNKLYILKPYQIYATEQVIDRVENTNLNGYVWHATGSGKTLTSFKISQILQNKDYLRKVIFIVDRKDLDYQTIREFNTFSKGCVDTTNNTTKLIEQLKDNNIKLIVTTIQKMNNIVKKFSYLNTLRTEKLKEELLKLKIVDIEFNIIKQLQNSKNVFIFDECHRSQFGEIHMNLKSFFEKTQMIGFTGTPIFAENSNNSKTTEELFTKMLHSYTILDAIEDENVLSFNLEYVNTFVGNKNIIETTTEKAYKINTKEIYHHKKRKMIVIHDILSKHSLKTNNKNYNGIFAVSSIDEAIEYYKLFKAKKTDLKIGSIFSFEQNEEDREDGNLEENNLQEEKQKKHSREELDLIIQDYNELFSTNFSTNTFNEYYIDIAKKIRNKELDIVIVVNMFLTGFDSKKLSVLYNDKELRYHGLIQAFSRTNRIDGINKPFGNIVSYKNIKDNVKEAICLFSNENAEKTIIQKPLNELEKDFIKALKELKSFTLTPKDVDKLKGEKNKKKFVIGFKIILFLLKKLSYFKEFDINNEKYETNENEINSFKSKYLNIYDSVKKNDKIPETSILNEISFEIDLLSNEKINVDYIIEQLLALKKNKIQNSKKIEEIFEKINSEPKLRLKKELIEDFFNETETNFKIFEEDQKEKEIILFCENNKLLSLVFKEILNNYSFNPKDNYFEGDNYIEVSKITNEKIPLLEKAIFIKKIENKIIEIYNKYIS